MPLGKTEVFINVDSKDGVVASKSFNVPGIDAADERVVTDTLRVALYKTMQWYVDNYMPLRFTGYAASELGWTIRPKTRRAKARQSQAFADAVLPNVFTGAFRKRALTETKPRTVAVGGARSMNVRCTIQTPGIPMGRNEQTIKCVKTITPREAERIAVMYEGVLRALVNQFQTTPHATRGGRIVTRTTMGDHDAVAIVASMRDQRGRFTQSQVKVG